MKIIFIAAFLFAVVYSQISCDPTSTVPCDGQACCECRELPNPQTGNGYLEFEASCLIGGDSCIASTGCRLCYREVGFLNNAGNRPLCARFLAPVDQGICSDDICCADKQHQNPLTGNGYLEFFAPCLNGGEDCIGNTGCRLCYRQVSGGVNVGNRTVCTRSLGL